MQYLPCLCRGPKCHEVEEDSREVGCLRVLCLKQSSHLPLEHIFNIISFLHECFSGHDVSLELLLSSARGVAPLSEIDVALGPADALDIPG